MKANITGFFELLPPEFLLTVCSGLITFLGWLFFRAFKVGKDVFIAKVESFDKKTNSLEDTVTSLKAAILMTNSLIASNRQEIRDEHNLTKDILVKTFVDSRDKAFNKITELTVLANELDANAHARAEMLRALDYKLDIAIQNFKDEQVKWGRVKILEEQVKMHQGSLSKVVLILDANGLVKNKKG